MGEGLARQRLISPSIRGNGPSFATVACRKEFSPWGFQTSVCVCVCVFTVFMCVCVFYSVRVWFGFGRNGEAPGCVGDRVG